MIERKTGAFLPLLLVLFYCNNPGHRGGDQHAETSIPLAQTPPMGWNSFDSYGVYLHEAAAMANLEAFDEKLKPLGYKYFVIDAGWFGEFKLREGTRYPREKHAEKLNFNEYGLLQPSKTYWPNGLQPLIDRCHQLGLKFGLHLMRGIPREVVRLNLPIKGTNYRAADIADTTSICTWNDQNYGVDMRKPGAQEFYNSLVNQMAEWGVDFIKYDDIVPYPEEVEAVAKAIVQCGRPMVLSLSPGDDVDENAIEFFRKANMLRVTHDIWDDKEGINNCFTAWRKWQGKEAPGFWIDMDMIPFGQLQVMSPKPAELTGDESKAELIARKKAGELSNVELLAGKGWKRESQFTRPQKYTFITLRALSASPLMMGGDLPTLDDFSLKLLGNEEMIACNQNGVMGKLITEQDSLEVWSTPERDTDNQWIGVFNRNSRARKVSITPGFLELPGSYSLKDIWNEQPLETVQACTIPGGGVLFIKANRIP